MLPGRLPSNSHNQLALATRLAILDGEEYTKGHSSCVMGSVSATQSLILFSQDYDSLKCCPAAITFGAVYAGRTNLESGTTFGSRPRGLMAQVNSRVADNRTADDLEHL